MTIVYPSRSCWVDVEHYVFVDVTDGPVCSCDVIGSPCVFVDVTDGQVCTVIGSPDGRAGAGYGVDELWHAEVPSVRVRGDE
jgi:methyl coenzyme M reductase beta subunit